MDLQLPLRSVVPTVEADVLYVFARTKAQLSGAEVHRLIPGTRSVRGVRLALLRLVDQGILFKTERSNLTLYTRNGQHLAWPSIDQLAGLSQSLDLKIIETVAEWRIQPISVSLFGSAARRDGGPDSDIDLLFIEPPKIPDDGTWEDDMESFTETIAGASGNHVQIMSLGLDELRRYVGNNEAILGEWQRDAKRLTGVDIRTLIAQVSG